MPAEGGRGRRGGEGSLQPSHGQGAGAATHEGADQGGRGHIVQTAG